MKKLTRRAIVFKGKERAGILEEFEGTSYRFIYDKDYRGEPISLTMPVEKGFFEFNRFPPFFDGLLPEGVMLEALLKRTKIDARDYFGQLLQVGKDLVGDVTVEESHE